MRAEAPEGLPTGQAIVAQLTNYGGNESSGALSPDGRALSSSRATGRRPTSGCARRQGASPSDSRTMRRLSLLWCIRLTAKRSISPGTRARTRPSGRSARSGAIRGKLLVAPGYPSPSRDGRFLAWLAREDNGGRFSLIVGRSDGANIRRVLVTDLSFQGLNRPSWWPRPAACVPAGQLFQTRNLFVADVASGQVRRVTRFERSTEGTITQAWLPDNRHLVVSYYSSPRAQLASDLGILDVDTVRSRD